MIALIIVTLNGKLVYDEINGWLETSENPAVIWFTVVPLSIGFLILLLYIVAKPFVAKTKNNIDNHSPHLLKLNFEETKITDKKEIAVSLDFSSAYEIALNSAIELGGKNANYTLIHIVETVGAIIYGSKTDDHETTIDEKLLLEYQKMLTGKGFKVEIQLGFGKPDKAIPKIINEGDFDVLVMGTHGHTGIKDLLFGTTVNKLRHKISIPLLIVKN